MPWRSRTLRGGLGLAVAAFACAREPAGSRQAGAEADAAHGNDADADTDGGARPPPDASVDPKDAEPSPGAEAAAPDEPAQRLLVSHTASGALGVFEARGAQLASVARLEVGSLPHRILLTASGDTAYVVLTGSQAIAEVDTAQLRVRRTFLSAPIPTEREDGSPIDAHLEDGALRAEVRSSGSCFSCHHRAGAEPTVVGERPFGIALSEDEQRLWVGHVQGGRLSELDLESGELTRSVELTREGTPEIADLTRVGSRLAVAYRPTQPSAAPGLLVWFDTQSLEPITEQTVGPDPASLLASEDQSTVFVSNFATNTVMELSPSALLRSFETAPGPLGTLALPGRELLSLDYYGNALSFIDLETSEVTTRPLELDDRTFVNPTHAALSPSGSTAYLVSSGTDGHLVALDVRERRVIALLPIEGLSFDVKRSATP